MWRWLVNLFRRKRLQVDSAAVSERGLVRTDNQDHFMVHRGRLAYCVADGMGGGDGGAKASEIVCRSVGNAVSQRVDFPERVKRIHEALAAANAEVRDYAAKAGFSKQMASTAAVLAIDADHGDQAVIGYVGDSRVYRFREGQLQQISKDHTIGRELSQHTTNRAVAAGLKGRNLAISHMLTRAVGVLPEVAPEWRKIDVRKGDAFLVCSDGVYDMVADEGLRAALEEGGAAREIVARIEARVVAAGAADNYSLVVVRTEAVK